MFKRYGGKWKGGQWIGRWNRAANEETDGEMGRPMGKEMLKYDGQMEKQMK